MSDVVQPGRSLEQVRAGLDAVDYLVDDGLAMALFLTERLGQPLLLEGEPGVGKTAAAKSLAESLGTPLIRLQCYEGITAAEALYEWNYARQLLAIRLGDGESASAALSEADLFNESYLLDRPLLKALRHTGPVPPVLLIDEIDRADDEFEALLFEFLGERSITIPEIGTITANVAPLVILTSNRSRELHDALKRRCYYHWIEFPDEARAAEIVRRRAPGADRDLVHAATAFIGKTRTMDLDKPPGIAEAVDWVSALATLGLNNLSRSVLDQTFGSILKTPDDLELVRDAVQAGQLDVGALVGAAE